MYLAHAEWEGGKVFSDTIENFLQEIAQEISEVVEGPIEAWCKSRPDVVQMFREGRLGKNVRFPVVSGTREPVSMGVDDRVFGSDSYNSTTVEEKMYSDDGS